MHRRSTSKTVALLLIAAAAMPGCSARSVLPADGPAGPPATIGQPAATTTTSAVVENDENGDAGTATPLLTDEVDSLLAELDETLSGLDRLLNDTAAAMAAEEGEIIP